MRHQAELQLRARREGVLSWELLDLEEERGFALLPAPDPGDVWFDMEGHPFFETSRGLEYLFGYCYRDDTGRRAVRRGLGTRPRGRAPGVRALRRLARRAASPPPGHARLPLRALRAHRADAADGAARHARDRDRRPPPRRGARRPLPRDEAGAPRLGRELLDQGDREALRVRAHRRRRGRRRVDRPLRGVGRDRRRHDPRGGRALQRGGLPLDVRAPRVAARDPPARPAVARPAGAPPAQGGARPARRGAGGARGAAARRCRGGHAATPARAPRRLPPARGAPAVVGLVPLAAARRRRARRRPDGDRPARVGRPAARGRRDEPRVPLHVPRAGAQARDEGVRPGHAARLSVAGRRRPRRRDAAAAGQARGGAAAARADARRAVRRRREARGADAVRPRLRRRRPRSVPGAHRAARAARAAGLARRRSRRPPRCRSARATSSCRGRPARGRRGRERGWRSR